MTSNGAWKFLLVTCTKAVLMLLQGPLLHLDSQSCIMSCKSKKNMGTNAHPWHLKLAWRSRARAQYDSPASGFLWSHTEQQVAAVNVLNAASLCVRPWKTKPASGSMPNTLRAWSLHNWAPPTCLTWEFSPSPAGLRSQDGRKRREKNKTSWSCFLSIVGP